ncbi:MAG: hypothetical protein ABIK92_06670 [Pseudomonadota bacterium]
MFERLLNWIGRNSTKGNRRTHNIPRPNSQDLPSKLDKLLRESRGWTDEDLKEIVESVYLLNSYCLKLRNDLSQLNRQVSSAINNQNSSLFLNHSQEINKSSMSIEPFSKIYEDIDVQNKSFVEKKPDNFSADKLNNLLMICRKYEELFEEAIKSLDNRSYQLVDNFNKEFKVPINQILGQKLKLEKSYQYSDPSKYKILFENLNNINLDSLSLSLCDALEMKITHGKTNADNQSNPILEKYIGKITEMLDWKVINPEAGSLYNEAEHDIFDRRPADNNKKGVIYKVHKRGFKDSGNKILLKAKVGITT